VIVESYEDVIVLSGALRSNFWETIHTAISLTLKRHASGVIIDCSGITEVTHAGADTFVDIMRFIHEHDARIIVAAVPPHVMDVLKAVPEVRSQLAVSDSVEAARKSLDLLVEEEQPGKKRQGPQVATNQKLLVALLGETTDPDALELVSEIADTVLAEVHIVYIILVPRDQPVQAPLPEKEQVAVAGIEKAKKYLSGRKVAYSARVERGRDVASAINAVLEEIEASHVVVPLSNQAQALEDSGRLVKTILMRVPKTVVFVRGPMK
jgi:anti-anti-sigma regulatory factor